MTTDTVTETTTPSAESVESAYTDEKRIYEIGYHLIPSLDENARGDAVDALRKAVEDHGGLILNETYPELIDLAYEMTHAMLGKRYRYTTAYFGWMFCEMDPAKLAEVEAFLKAHDSILRSIVVVTDRAHALASTSYSFKKEGSMMLHTEDEEESEESEGESEQTTEEQGEISEEEVDKAIGELIGDEEEKEAK